jgi:hypothetical protein
VVGATHVEHYRNPVADPIGEDAGITELLDHDDVRLTVDSPDHPDSLQSGPVGSPRSGRGLYPAALRHWLDPTWLDTSRLIFGRCGGRAIRGLRLDSILIDETQVDQGFREQ